MAILTSRRRLKKELTLLNVYAIATGTTLSAGFFLLPGLAAAQIGSTLVLAYLIAALPLIPAMFSVVELATAMPRAGGVYYFLDRSLGPLVGTVGGVGTWLAVSLKAAFALVGMGAYLALFSPSSDQGDRDRLHTDHRRAMPLRREDERRLPGPPCHRTALHPCGLHRWRAAAAPGVSLRSVLRAGSELDPVHRRVSCTSATWASTTVASLAEEVKDPERNLPLGVFLALGTAILVYGLGTSVIVGLVPPDRLAGDLTSAATAADILIGGWGTVLISVAAILAFTSVANAGLLSASRLPLAMTVTISRIRPCDTSADAARRPIRSCSPSGSLSWSGLPRSDVHREARERLSAHGLWTRFRSRHRHARESHRVVRSGLSLTWLPMDAALRRHYRGRPDRRDGHGTGALLCCTRGAELRLLLVLRSRAHRPHRCDLPRVPTPGRATLARTGPGATQPLERKGASRGGSLRGGHRAGGDARRGRRDVVRRRCRASLGPFSRRACLASAENLREGFLQGLASA